MDLKAYYQKLRTTEGSIAEPQAILVSLATPDGGRAGVLTEAPRAVAAKMIVEGSARLATEEESEGFRAQAAETQAPGRASGHREPHPSDGCFRAGAEKSGRFPQRDKGVTGRRDWESWHYSQTGRSRRSKS